MPWFRKRATTPDDEREEFLFWPLVFALAMFIVLAVMALGR